MYVYPPLSPILFPLPSPWFTAAPCHCFFKCNFPNAFRVPDNVSFLAGIFGPAATKWFDFLVRRVNLPSKNGTILARVACDQFLFAPVNMTVFLSSMAYMEGNSPSQRLKDAFLPGYQKNLMIWPWVQFTNFKYVPAEMRVLVVNIISLGKFSPVFDLRIGMTWANQSCL